MAPRWAVKIVKIFVLAIVFLGIFVIGFGAAVQHLWNWLLPSIFGLHTISYWQAVGLLGLSWLLFGGPRAWMGPRMYRRQHMRERWGRMTPEQREQFRAAMRGRCGHFGSSAAESKA
ncbi:MAG TPA: hypothetical protein VH596_10620 [Terriglobales bacterium]